MITREEYNKALDVLEAYQKQIFGEDRKIIVNKKGKTRIEEWQEFTKCSQRLKNALKNLEVYDKKEKSRKKVIYIEDVTKVIFLKQRRAGWKSWHEFIELRGY